LRITSSEIIGVVRIAPVITSIASLCTLEMITLAVFCWVFGHQIKEEYAMIGVMTVLYSQKISCGFKPYRCPKILSHAMRVVMAFALISVKYGFHESFLLRVTLRYFVSVESSIWVPFNRNASNTGRVCG
jgi:hypothetical protein